MTKLGAGRFGVVHLEWDELTGRQQAVKYVDTTCRTALDQAFEPKAMALAEHENVVRVYHAESQGENLVIRMEYLPGGSVQDRYEGKPIPVRRALDIIEDACRGVQHLHSQGLLHRDIKPANLLIDDHDQIKVSDFGLASLVTSSRTVQDGTYVPVTPPECWADPTTMMTTAGDVYALGCTAYRLINGDVMFYGAYPLGGVFSESVIAGTFPNRRTWQPYVHDSLRRVIRRAMDPDPEKRYATPSDFRSAITRVQPQVSWGQEEDGFWIGEGTCGESWRVSLQLEEGLHIFVLKKGRKANVLREVRPARLATPNQGDVEKHAQKVMQWIAHHGRWDAKLVQR